MASNNPFSRRTSIPLDGTSATTARARAHDARREGSGLKNEARRDENPTVDADAGPQPRTEEAAAAAAIVDRAGASSFLFDLPHARDALD